MLKICAISDTHCSHHKLDIPYCDVLIHAGDSTWQGRYHEVLDFREWFVTRPATHKICIAGNHELSFDASHCKYDPSAKDLITRCDDIIYLENKAVVINGVKFYGTPWTPFFHDWAFNGFDAGMIPFANKPFLKDIYARVDDDTDVLICHGPCFGLVDQGGYGNEDERFGSFELLKRAQGLKQLKLTIGGHIHEARGVTTSEGKTYANVASLDRDYKTIRPPMIFNLDEETGVVTYEQ